MKNNNRDDISKRKVYSLYKYVIQNLKYFGDLWLIWRIQFWNVV